VSGVSDSGLPAKPKPIAKPSSVCVARDGEEGDCDFGTGKETGGVFSLLVALARLLLLLLLLAGVGVGVGAGNWKLKFGLNKLIEATSAGFAICGLGYLLLCLVLSLCRLLLLLLFLSSLLSSSSLPVSLIS
jgi:hypothetical protein